MVLSENQIAQLSVCKTQAPFPLKKWGLVLIAELFSWTLRISVVS
jgi:hypothetical protein